MNTSFSLKEEESYKENYFYYHTQLTQNTDLSVKIQSRENFGIGNIITALLIERQFEVVKAHSRCLLAPSMCLNPAVLSGRERCLQN